GRQPGGTVFRELARERRGGKDPLTQLYEGFDALAPYRVGTANCRIHGDGGVPGQTVLDLPRANAITTTGNQIILASDEPKIPLVVLACQIAGQGPVANEFVCSRL